MTPRRYYLRKRLVSRLTQDGLEEVWHAKQIELPGEPLAEGFPFRSRLAVAGYVAREDLDGATSEELHQAGLSRREAAAVIAALKKE